MTRPAAALAKTTRPSVSGALARTRLFRRLDRHRARQVVWVTGPPGCGKTTLVASYLARRRLGGLWYQVDDGDADVATFFYYMSLAARRAAPRARRPLPLLTPEYRPRLGTFTRRFFEELYHRLPRRFVLVFDNYQEVPPGSQFHEVIRDALAALPASGAVVVVSRDAPPPALARLRASGRIDVLGWEALRLTPQESAALVRLRARDRLPPDTVRRLHGTTEGWAAGLILMLERMRAEGGTTAPPGLPARDATFEYFAGEILARTDRPTRQLLLRTAFLPRMTARMAAELSGIDRADRILAALHRRNYFTERRGESEPVYQYHPLFAEFLRTHARETLTTGALGRVQRRAAGLVAAAGQVEDAVALLREARAWSDMAGVVLHEAPFLVAQGRSQTLGEWLRALPADLGERSGWVQYWLGVCGLPASLARSREHFQRAFALLRAARDAAGAYLAWAGAVDATLYEWGDVTPLDGWIERLDELRRAWPAYPSTEIEARVAASMFSALMFRQPQHPGIETWARAAFALAGNVPNVDHRLLMGFHLTLYRLWLGDLGAAAEVVEALRAAARSGDASPMARLTWSVAEAAYHWHRADADACLALVHEGLELGRTAGIRLWDYQFQAQGVYGALARGDAATARRLLREMAPVLEGTRRLDAAHYHFLAAWETLLRRDLPTALRHAETGLGLAVEAGTPFPEALNHLALAQVLHERGRDAEAREHVAGARAIGRAMGSRMLAYMGGLAEAQLALDRGDEAAGLAALREALAIGRDGGYVNTPWWRPDVMARLAVRALGAGIEVAYVRDLVGRRGLTPDEPPVEVEGWPWALRVRALGHFALVRDGTPLRPAGKVQKMPMGLLQALVAFGGRDVAEGQLVEALWPDAEGDAGHQALATTLHRLRQLVGHDGAFVLRGGRVSADPRVVWVDAWAFERLAAQAEAAERRGDRPTAVRRMEEALALYRGPFLAGDAGVPWAVPLRERLRRRFLRQVAVLGRHWAEAGEWTRAVECYEKGLEVDDLAEEFYQGLMAAYGHLGRRAEALAAYARCRDALAATLGIAPSPETEALHRALRAEPERMRPN